MEIIGKMLVRKFKVVKNSTMENGIIFNFSVKMVLALISMLIRSLLGS